MPDVNEAIVSKLKHFSPEVAKVAIQAVRLAGEQLPQASIAEQIEAMIRQAVRASEAKE